MDTQSFVKIKSKDLIPRLEANLLYIEKYKKEACQKEVTAEKTRIIAVQSKKENSLFGRLFKYKAEGIQKSDEEILSALYNSEEYNGIYWIELQCNAWEMTTLNLLRLSKFSDEIYVSGSELRHIFT